MLSYLILVQKGETLHSCMKNILFASNAPSALVRLIAFFKKWLLLYLGLIPY